MISDTKRSDDAACRNTRLTETSVTGQCDACAPMFVDEPVLLSAWLHLTDRCNLRCAYCYLPHKPADMSLQTGYAAIDATFRSAASHGYQQIRLKYAGGEPLLQFPLLTSLQVYAQTHASQHDIALDGVVLSNGTLLTAAIIDTMQSLHLRLMISLDGLGNAHDCQRPYASGRGSAADVLRGVELAIQHGLIPDISVTVSGRNAHGLSELVAWLLAHNLPFSLNFYRENDLSSSNEDLRLEEQAIIEGMLAAYRVIEEHKPQHSMLPGFIDRANLTVPHLRPCGARHSYLVFDEQGSVACCPMDKRHTVATTYDDDPLIQVRTSRQAVQNPAVTTKAQCRSCEWSYTCAGGCPLETYRATGRYDLPSPNCAIYKALYPTALYLAQPDRQ